MGISIWLSATIVDESKKGERLEGKLTFGWEREIKNVSIAFTAKPLSPSLSQFRYKLL